jgi:hypothetical protein
LAAQVLTAGNYVRRTIIPNGADKKSIPQNGVFYSSFILSTGTGTISMRIFLGGVYI